MALLQPSTNPKALVGIGLFALALAIASATQDIVIDAYRTDLLSEEERGAGAASASLGYRAAGLFISSGGFLLAGTYGWPAAFAAAAGIILLIIPITIKAPTIIPLSKPITSLRQAILGPTKEFLTRTGNSKAPILLMLVLFYRWPDGLLNAMAIPFLSLSGFSEATIGLVQGAWGIGATMIGTVIGGILFSHLSMNRSLWIFSIVGVAGNLSYGALAQFQGGLPALMFAAALENIGGGMVGAAFVALLMSLCNPKFSATQYALLSGIYALSRSLLSAPAGLLADRIGWPEFFLLSAAASMPAFILLAYVAPWHEKEARGAFDPEKDLI
jgi:PAT family beta-lactamase induction signal transducer AmpG